MRYLFGGREKNIRMDVEEAYTLVRKEEATELYLPAPTTVSETKQNESGNESEPIW